LQGTTEASLSAEEQAKKARDDAARAERFGIEDKKPAPSSPDGAEGPINVDDFNPVILGRKSRCAHSLLGCTCVSLRNQMARAVTGAKYVTLLRHADTSIARHHT
jgi:hypothetical protein